VPFRKLGYLLILIRNFLLLMICCESRVSLLVRSLWNSREWYRELDKHLRNFNLLTLTLLDKIFIISPVRHGAKLVAFMVNLPLGIPPWPSAFSVPRQSRFMIAVDPNNNPMFDVIENSDRLCWGSDPIECIYSLKPHPGTENDPKPDSVILDAHGGAFVSGCPELHLIYCQRWAQRMPGVGVLQVRYTLCPDAQFPVQVQQLLDTYLWLISGRDSVRKLIGFHPKKIILAGDSAGALFVMSLVIVLNEIRKKLHPGLQMPVAVFSFYGAFSVVPIVTAATLTSPFHFLLVPNAMLCASRNYRPDMENISQIIRRHSIPEIYGMIRNPKPNIFMQEAELVLEELRKQEGITDHPFLSPINYDDFDSLSDVELHCTSTHSEAILDSTITMLKRWRGPSSLAIMGDLVHGHLNSIGFNRQHDEAFEETVNKLRSVLDIPCTHSPASPFSFIEYMGISLTGVSLALLFKCYNWMTGAN
jgi:acetyl esterase/lipase